MASEELIARCASAAEARLRQEGYIDVERSSEPEQWAELGLMTATAVLATLEELGALQELDLAAVDQHLAVD